MIILGVAVKDIMKINDHLGVAMKEYYEKK